MAVPMAVRLVPSPVMAAVVSAPIWAEVSAASWSVVRTDVSIEVSPAMAAVLRWRGGCGQSGDLPVPRPAICAELRPARARCSRSRPFGGELRHVGAGEALIWMLDSAPA